ncbi:hypothetical protein DASC09_060530 [Saccharomycopsis crataegensis]|uniref:Ankyrin n=1 Tax=Saccharomycopsis crataegensis TaxID=43959 RepID=A0AAV5QW19_9ASCO|nr:hypothetical protein DASC09_060530 [Saccharomycopsis crataegensis]
MVANIWVAASDGDTSTVKKYIESGEYSATSKDPNGYTPIHAAAAYGHIELLEYLIGEKKGDVNVLDSDGDTPLHHCDELEPVKVLVEKFGADWKIKNQDGETALDAYDGEDIKVTEYLQGLAGVVGSQKSNEGSINIGSLGALIGELSDEEREKIRLTFENVGDLNGDVEFDETQQKMIEEIANGENGEERMKEFIQQVVRDNLGKLKQSTDDEPSNKRRRD